MKVITGIAIIKDAVGKRVAYTYSEIDENGTMIDTNKKASYVVLDAEEIEIIKELEEKVATKMV